MSQLTTQSKSSEALLLPPPPLAYNRKQKKMQVKAEGTEQHKEAMRGFLLSQQRYIRDQILIDELCPYSSPNHPAEEVLFEVVLNAS
jgi:hypothetical protein